MPIDTASPNTDTLRSAIVFGGAGFIGARMLRQLAQAGVENLTSADLERPATAIDGVHYIACDVRKSIELDRSYDVAYNFAAVHRTPGHPDDEYFETNIAGAINVTNFARRNNIKTIVFTSSIAVYGPSEDPKTESTEPVPVSSYGKSKLLAEDIHRQWADEDPERRLVVVRPAVIFGRGENGNFDRLLRLVGSRTFVYPGRRDTIKSCGNVAELVRSLEWVRERTTGTTTYNFAYPERPTIQQIVETIADTTKSARPRINLPLNAMLAAARGFEVVDPGSRTGINRARIMKLVRSTNIVPKLLVDSGYPWATDMRAGVRHWLRERAEGRALLLPAAGTPANADLAA